MKREYLKRLIPLVGEENLNIISSRTVLIAGIGGVGGSALIALARSGFKKFIIIDSDVVDPSNLNRQLLFKEADIGKSKVEVAKEEINKLSSDIEVVTISIFLKEENIMETLKDLEIDALIDAIDYVDGKVGLIKYALDNNIPFISSLGMGNRLLSNQIEVTHLNKTHHDPLAKKLREKVKKVGIEPRLVPVAFSKEEPAIKGEIPYSLIFSTSSAGLILAEYIFTLFIKNKV